MREEPRGTRTIRCPSCQRYYRVSGTAVPPPGSRLRCTKCGAVFALGGEAEAAAAVVAAAPAAARGRVLVATDGAEFQTLIGEVLRAEGWHLRLARSGEDAWEGLRSWQPRVALLDVALPGVPAFELCDRVRADAGLRRTGIILIASVFEHTRYKRAPTSLYGADDYIEKHHIRDWLPKKVERLAPGRPPSPPPAAPSEVHDPAAPRLAEGERERLIREEVDGPKPPARPGLERLRESLRRYARIIVSDIALYNQELVEQGIREGTFLQLLKKELEEGHRLYLTRVPPSAREEDHYQEAVRNFVSKRKAAHGGGPAHRGPGGHGRP